jgi:DNA (cytosine-5)-methyltransferase 1
MNYLSVCSGIEAATVAWHDMGWNAVGYSEIEKFPSQLLAHHYPNVTNYGDMTKFKEWNINEPVNLLVGGTPCQSFSIAGLRKGLADPRGNLMLTYLAMANHFKPKWLLWENVPGVLSSNGGHDFAALLQGMAECGYGVAYRVLDAQHFGVPQRRRRVFVVGCLGDWRGAAKVLFESESLCRNITPSRDKGKEIANCLTKSPSSYNGFNPASHEGNGVVWPAPIASTLNASFGSKLRLENQHINSGAPLFVQTTVYESHGQDARYKELKDVCSTVSATYGTGGGNVPLVHAFKVRGGCSGGGKGYLGSDEKAFTISTAQDQQLFTNMRVRRLTPMECERLQGFPDNYTNTPTSSDSTRYKALGNSMAVPVMRWIGNRINNV